MKYYFCIIIRNILKLFWILPINDKKIFFLSFGGSKIACNPLYIFNRIKVKHFDYKYVWAVDNPVENTQNNVLYVKKKSLKFICEILTSKVIVNNNPFSSFLPYRQKQVLIQTWHGGGAYKRVGRGNTEKNTKYVSDKLTYFISSCKMFTEVMSKTEYVDEKKFLPIGMPRNDVFFDKDKITANSRKVRLKYNLKENDYVILYAPTYRGEMKSSNFVNTLNFEGLKKTVSDKYQRNAKILIRYHYSIKQSMPIGNYDYDVFDYPDMQELLCAADMLITDYSSSMWDYSFLYRPCILFAPDIEYYMHNRGFYTEPCSWGFPICKSNEELASTIIGLDTEKYVASVKKHHDNLGSYENGDASKKIIQIIEKQLDI